MSLFKSEKNKNKSDAVVIPSSEQPIGPHTVLAVDASVADGRVAPGQDPVADEIAALEADAATDPQMEAAAAAEVYDLTPGARSLLDRAVDSLSSADGASIEDPDFKLAVRNRSALLSASGGDLAVALSCIVQAMSADPRAISGTVYSLCYATLKQAVFYCNLDYRRYLDPRGDFDLTSYRHPNIGDDYNPAVVQEALGLDFSADQREERRDAPPGLDSELEREWAYFGAVYGSTVDSTEDVFAASLADLRTYLQLLTEAFGWTPDSPMPYANVMRPDGGFDPITDPMVALDNQELSNKERRKVRQVKQANAMLAAAQIAAARLTAAAKRPSPAPAK